MKRNFLIGTLMLAAGALLAADAKDELASAGKKLAEKDNYSWKQTMEFGGGNFGPMTAEGKADKGSLWVSSQGMNNNTIEAVKKGEKGAIKTQDGWQSVEELSGQQGPGRMGAGMIRNLKAPAAQVEDFAKQMKEVKKEGDVYSGDLTEEGAKSYLTFGRRGGAGGNAPQISGAKGSVKVWLKDNLPAKYVLNVKGTISTPNGDRDMDRTTTVEIKDIGSTKLEVPAEAKKKLE